MRCVVVVLVLLAAIPLTTTALWSAEEFAVSLSASDSDPWSNHADAVEGTEFSVYLWLTCGLLQSTVVGFHAIEALVQTADYTVADFKGLNGVLVASDDPEHILLAVGGCPQPPFLVGRWTIENTNPSSAGAICLASPYGEPAPSCVVDHCEQLPIVDLAGVTGFSVGDSTSCEADNGCVKPTPVEPTSWGRIKRQYN